jgi:hypothetical protein
MSKKTRETLVGLAAFFGMIGLVFAITLALNPSMK